jgi:hypothetical protein
MSIDQSAARDFVHAGIATVAALRRLAVHGRLALRGAAV